MQNALVILLLVSGPLLACIAIIRMPSWLARDLQKQRMWLLRDVVVDDIRAGRLPADHPAVRQLLARVQSCIYHADRVTLLDLYVFKWAMRPLTSATRASLSKQMARADLRGLDERQRELVDEYWKKLRTLLGGAVILGSWLGLLSIIPQIPRAIRAVRREERSDGHPAPGHMRPLIRPEDGARSVRKATDLVASSHFGQQVTELAEQKREMLTVH
jgi:hypothetical protein